jgi:hypothetical protein
VLAGSPVRPVAGGVVPGTPQLDRDPVNEVVVAPLTPDCRQAEEDEA